MQAKHKRYILKSAIVVILVLLSVIAFGTRSQDANTQNLTKYKTRELWRVAHVIDGDTIIIKNANKTLKARLLGVDSPEKDGPYTKRECFSKEAEEFSRKQLKDKEVYIEFDPTQSKFDKYGRALVYVYTKNGGLFNKKLIEQGYAHEFTYKGMAYKKQKEFKLAEKRARKLKLGLWSKICNSIDK